MSKPILEYTKTELAHLIAHQWEHWCHRYDITPEFVTVLPDEMTQSVMFDCDRSLYTVRAAAYGYDDVTQVYTIQPENVHRVILWLNPKFPPEEIAIPRANVPYGETPVKAKKPTEEPVVEVPLAEAERAEAELAEAERAEAERAEVERIAEAEKAAVEAEKIATDAAKKEDENAKKFANAQAEASKSSSELEKAQELVKISPKKGPVRENARKFMGEKRKIADKAIANVIAAEASLKKATEEVRRARQVAQELRAIADALARARAEAIAARQIAEESAAEAKEVEDATTADAEIAEDEAENAELIAFDAEMRAGEAEETVRYATSAVVIEEMGLTVPERDLPTVPLVPFRVTEAAPDPEKPRGVSSIPLRQPQHLFAAGTQPLTDARSKAPIPDAHYRKTTAEFIYRAIDAESRRLCPWIFEKAAYFVDVVENPAIGELSDERARSIAEASDARDIVNALDERILSAHSMTRLVLWRALAKHVGSREPITQLSKIVWEFSQRDLEQCRNLAMVEDDDITCMAAAASAAIPRDVVRERLDMTEAQCKSQFFELGKYVNAPSADVYYTAQIRGWSPRNQQEFRDGIEAKRSKLTKLAQTRDVYIDGMPLAEFIVDLI